MTQADDIVIGELSGFKVLAPCLGWAILLALMIAGAAPIWMIPVVGIFLVSSMSPALAVFRGGKGLYIRDGRLHQHGLREDSVGLDEIRLARREVPFGGEWLRTSITIEIGSSEVGLSPGFYETSPRRLMLIYTTLYSTPAEEMLARLAAHGVKVVGSKTALLDLPGRR